MTARRDMLSIKKVEVLIPVYNSEATIGPLIDAVLDSLACDYEDVRVILVNDGSSDSSHARILSAVERYPGKVRYIRLMSNFGEHNAVFCGCHFATADALVVIDDDFQNPVSEIKKLLERLAQGYDVVYASYEVKKHGLLRNFTSRATFSRHGSWGNRLVYTCRVSRR